MFEKGVKGVFVMLSYFNLRYFVNYIDLVYVGSGREAIDMIDGRSEIMKYDLKKPFPHVPHKGMALGGGHSALRSARKCLNC